MIRRPPSSTLFPYTTLSDLVSRWSATNPALHTTTAVRPRPARCGITSPTDGRSEEHTSELQSHHDLVCRLLLETKKPTTTPPPPGHGNVTPARTRATASHPL